MTDGEQQKVGLIGLGSMGKAIARKFISEDIEVLVWNRTPEKARSLDLEPEEHPRDVTAGTSTVILCLRDSEAVKSVMASGKGLIKTDLDGQVVVDTTTHDPDEVEQFYEVMDAHRAYYLEAPLSGRPEGAREGRLTLFAGGNREAWDVAEPVVSHFSGSRHFFEDRGTATRVALINRLVEGGIAAIVAEAILLGRETGLERSQMISLLKEGGSRPALIEYMLDRFEGMDFEGGFSSGQMREELDLVSDLASASDRPLFTGNLVKELFARTLRTGDGSRDLSILLEVLD